MLGILLQLVVVVLPTVLAILMEIATPEMRQYRHWRKFVMAFGFILSALVLFQILYSNKMARIGRENAIKETSKQVAAETSKEVTKSVANVYARIVSEQQKQIQELQSQIAAQGKKVDVISSSNIVTGKKPVKVEVMNPPSAPEAPASHPLPNLSWTQEPGPKTKDGKAITIVTFRVDDFLPFPAFLV